MNILIDFIPFQYKGGVGGAASFAKAVYDKLLTSDHNDIHIYATCDSTLPIGQQYDYRLFASDHNITLLDLSLNSIASYVKSEHIDTFFIAIGQFYASYDLSGIKCKTVMFIHDIVDIERTDNRIDLMLHDKTVEPTWKWLKHCANLFVGRWEKQNRALYNHIMTLYTAPTTLAYTVSDYSRDALRYFFPQLKKDIKVCYSPLRAADICTAIEEPLLQQLVESGKPFLLMLAANRRFKNVKTVTKVFLRLLSDYPDLHLLTLKYGHTVHSQHIDIPFLSDSDIEHAYKHAHCLVFASFFEGFGYPPIEALRHGTPTVASNVTSIPEILGDAGIYFSPFYPADLYRALRLVLANRDIRHHEMEMQLAKISSRQEEDLMKLVDCIMRHS